MLSGLLLLCMGEQQREELPQCQIIPLNAFRRVTVLPDSALSALSSHRPADGPVQGSHIKRNTDIDFKFK